MRRGQKAYVSGVALQQQDKAQQIATFPFGHRSPKGRIRWYLAEVPQGQEHTFSERLHLLLPKDILSDAFVPVKERWCKRGGIWSVSECLMYRGFIFVASPDVISLGRAFASLSFPIHLVGSNSHAYTPLSDEAVSWLFSVMDNNHIIRSSTGAIKDGVLHIERGPLAGQERCISKIDRHKRVCVVRINDGKTHFSERLALEVPHKS